MRAKARKISLYLLFFVTLLAYFSAWWAVRTYGSISMEEIVFHLNVPLDGVNTEYIVSYLGTALAPSLAVFCIAMFLYRRCCLFLRTRKTYTCVDVRLGKKRWYVELTDRAFSKSMALLLAFGLVFMAVGTDNLLNIGEYLYNQFHKSSFKSSTRSRTLPFSPSRSRRETWCIFIWNRWKRPLRIKKTAEIWRKM